MKKNITIALLIINLIILIYIIVFISNNNITYVSEHAFDIKDSVWVTRIADTDKNINQDTIMILHFKNDGTVGSKLLRETDAYIEFINEYDFDIETQTGIVYYPTKEYVIELIAEYGKDVIESEKARPFGTLNIIDNQLYYNDKILEKTTVTIAEMMCYLFKSMNIIE